ncbi:Integral membrane protein [Acidisarcina polymorpha]|uniref:Integral membrane protein n=1 Tax=Acidisarcina polymorpha TaxID=2211140 RepID=A0A2Z5FWU7_9BACT|nr:DMT family transporter [Acidisarcina polymorpha]AXC10865.1 Integral membrane protein [Acidisarcina polymorpha]
MSWLFILLALLAGAANPFQAGANAQLNKQLGHPVLAGVVVYATGLAGLLLVLLARHSASPSQPQIASVNWWAWLGGLISIGSTMAGLMLAQKLGSVAFTGCSITASLIMSVTLDQFGWMGFRQHAASPGRLVGCCLLAAGVWLVARG